MICCKYYEIDGVVNFFAKQTVLKQPFRTIHQSTDMKDLTYINAKCKGSFSRFPWRRNQESDTAIKQATTSNG